MSTKEAQRFGIMQQVDKKVLTLRKASEELGLSLSQTKKIRKRYRLEGPEGLISKHLGKISPNRTDPKIKSGILEILKSEAFEGFGPTFARDKIEKRCGYHLSSETIRKWMLTEGLWIPKKKKKCKVYQRRQRRGKFGDLIQGDGSRHAWLEERGPECTMVVYVDDATSKITAARFVPAETTESYQQILEQHLSKYGVPKALYVDKHAIFLTSRDSEMCQKTHFARVLKDLGIELIFANSPQAKGRVERVHGTLQDRLIKEMRLQNICTIKEANAFLPMFIEIYNAKYGVEAREIPDGHRHLDAEVNLTPVAYKE
ncbi:MAG: ISNCY family transposase [Pseudobdellovibrionaceae bacterium]|nr:ISNCY family transposase [Halobacteriovoraceae bacterium]